MPPPTQTVVFLLDKVVPLRVRTLLCSDLKLISTKHYFKHVRCTECWAQHFIIILPLLSLGPAPSEENSLSALRFHLHAAPFKLNSPPGCDQPTICTFLLI